MREQRPQAQQDDGVPLHPRGVRADRQHGRLERHEQAGLHHGEADRDRDNGEAVVAPSGDAALNALGLDTQVPAKLVYVSSGPYKRYEYGPYDIELRHRANRDLLDCSQITCTIVQALKVLGRENVGDEEIGTLARNLTEEQAGAFLEESAGLTSWVADAAKKIWEAKHGQDR